MLITSALLFIAMREIWGWSLAAAGAVAGAFVIVDASFFAANLAKVAEGGYVPLVLAALVYGVMYIWHLGAAAVIARLEEQTEPADHFCGADCRGACTACSRHRRIPDTHAARRTAGHGLACLAQPRAA
jgi:K+ transporter